MSWQFGALVRCAFVASIALVFAVACGPAADDLPARVKAAEALTPKDPRLAEIYSRTCRVCHINPDSGAPLAGDARAWHDRLAQSDDVLATHLRDGFKAMPPRGACFDCSDDDLKHLMMIMGGRAQ